MRKYAEKRLALKRNNPIKEAYSLLLSQDLTHEDAIRLIDDVYNLLLEISNVEVTDEVVKDYILNTISTAGEDIDKLKYFMDNPQDVNVITFKAYTKDYPNYYRIFRLPEFVSVAYLVYTTLASFEFCVSTDYIVDYDNLLFTKMSEIDDEELSTYSAAEVAYLFVLELQKKDVLHLNYNVEEWEINIEVLDIKKDYNEKEHQIYVEAVGPNPFEEEKEIFEALDNKDYKLAKKLCNDDHYYHSLVNIFNETIHNNKNKKFDEYYATLDELYEIYEEDYKDLTDEESDDYSLNEDNLNEISQLKLLKMKELDNVPLIKQYDKVKAIYFNILTQMVDYFQKNEEHYNKMMRNYFSTRRQAKLPKEIEVMKVELDQRSASNLMLSYVFPVGANYESVSQYYNRKKIFKGEEQEMLNSIIDSEYGIYRILSHDFYKGTITLKNVITNKVFDMVDRSLLVSLEFEPDCPLMVLRIISYKGINFGDAFELLYEDDEVKKYIEKIKKYLPSAIDFYFNIVNIKNKQKNNY